jgi:uncharacterized membrane protein YwaF
MEREIMKQILEKIKEYKRILIFRHFRPDGDAVGSTKGFQEILRQSFPDKEILLANDDYADYLAFLGPEDGVIADELFKIIVLVIGHNYNFTYLPLHLCSINIFLILWHAIKPNRLLGNFLYTVCIPGAMAALLFPSWSSLPITSGMHIHSFTVHILLALYPIVLTAAGEIRPTLRQLPLCLGLLAVLAAFAYGVNVLLDTNFMFLMYAEEGNPLAWFGANWGSHLLGFPVIMAGVILVMYLPIVLCRRGKKVNQ